MIIRLHFKKLLVVLRNILFANTKTLKPICHLLKYELLLMADYAVTVINMSVTYTIIIAAVPGTSPD